MKNMVKSTNEPSAPSVLVEAEDLVSGKRQHEYGTPADNFGRIAEMWSVIVEVEISAEQVGLMMIALKLARHIHSPKRDNLVDIAGYARTIELLE